MLFLWGFCFLVLIFAQRQTSLTLTKLVLGRNQRFTAPIMFSLLSVFFGRREFLHICYLYSTGYYTVEYNICCCRVWLWHVCITVQSRDVLLRAITVRNVVTYGNDCIPSLFLLLKVAASGILKPNDNRRGDISCLARQYTINCVDIKKKIVVHEWQWNLTFCPTCFAVEML